MKGDNMANTKTDHSQVPTYYELQPIVQNMKAANKRDKGALLNR